VLKLKSKPHRQCCGRHNIISQSCGRCESCSRELRNRQNEFVGRILEHWNWANAQKGTKMVEIRQISDDGGCPVQNA
jgi:hypothetical protein